MPDPTHNRTWWVTVKEDQSDEIVKRVGPYSTERRAEKALDALSINLNHDDYSVEIEERRND